MPKQKGLQKARTDADDLVRQVAGNYLSGDERFEVRQSDSAWYLVDRQQTNEFGQELMHGPFASMKAAKAQMPGARGIKPLLRSVTRPRAPAPKKEPPKPEPTWIDKLPADEAAEVRKLIRTLERDGIAGADDLARKDRQGKTPAVASALLQRALQDAIDEMPDRDREAAQRVIARIDEVVSGGESNRDPLPGWALFEVGPDRAPTGRRLRLGD